MDLRKGNKRQMASPISILMVVVILASLSTWILPAGSYHKLSYAEEGSFVMESASGRKILPATQETLDSLGITISLEKFKKGEIRKSISLPGTYQKAPAASPQGPLKILQAPIKGIYESIDIILLVLFIGGFIHVFNQTGALVSGIGYLSASIKGRESMLIIILTTIFSFLGSSYGMAEESLVFYPLLVPLFLAAGYDLLVPFAVIFGGVTIGGISGFSNPFSTIIASNAAGINWMDGLYQRLAIFAITTVFFIWYLLRYASKVKANPANSLVLKIDGGMQLPFELEISETPQKKKLQTKTLILLAIYLLTFLAMIFGVIFLDWWTMEMSSLFLGSALLVAVVSRIPERVFVGEFMKGAEGLLSVAFIIGVAIGVSVVLNEGMVTDTILFEASKLMVHVPGWVIILFLFGFYFFLSLFISSSSGMAVLTMPIMGALAVLVNVPGREVVNAYLFGINIMALISPTNLILPSLAMVNMSYTVWLKFIRPIIGLFMVICALFLLIGIKM